MANELTMNVGDPVARAKAKSPAVPREEDLAKRMETFMAPSRRELSEAIESEQKFKTASEADLAERTARLKERGATALREEAKTIQQAPEQQEIDRLEKELNVPFTPTQDNAVDLAAIFSLIGVIGFAIGAGGKNSAQAAMSAMNGMAEGYQKGRMDLYKKEKDIFDENLKQLKSKADSLYKRLEQITKIAATNRQAAQEEANSLFAQEGASFLKDYAAKYGLPKSLELAKENVRSAEKLFDMVIKQEEIARQKEQARRDRLSQLQPSFTFIEKDGKVYALNNKNPADIREIDPKLAGGVRAFAAGGKGSVTSALLAGRAENIREAFAQAAKDIVNITKFPPDTMLGTFSGLTGASADGMASGIRNAIARGITDKEQRMLETLIAGIEGHMAFALGGGYASSQSKARMDQYKSQIARAGDDPAQVPLMLAKLKQEMNILAENFPSKPGATAEMSAAVNRYNDEINTAIPFTVEDVLAANLTNAPASPSAGSGRRIVRQGKVTEGPNKGKTIVEYSDGTKEYK